MWELNPLPGERSMSEVPHSSNLIPAAPLSQRWHWASKQAVSFLMQQAVENPDCLSLAAGLVDSTTLPVAATQTALTEIFSEGRLARPALQYGSTAGAHSLRQQILELVAELEQCPREQLGVTVDQVVLTTGSQQLLSLVGEVLMNPGDICLVAAPTYYVFLGLLEGLGVRAVSVPSDEQGMQSEALEQTLLQLEAAGELQRVKLVYLVSYFENPSGVSLSDARRTAILELVQRFSREQRILILEDAAYRELRYDGPDLPSIWSRDQSNSWVILAQTFSKTFSPGLRVGFGILPSELVQPILDRKSNEDFGSPHFNQQLLNAVLERGLYRDHVQTLRHAYRNKRDAMLQAADRYFQELKGVEWVRPHGGLYVWVTIPEGIPTGFDSPLFQQATQCEQVMYVPGELCFANGPEQRPQHHIRLSFGVQTPEGIDEGMRRLARALRHVL